MRETRAQGRRIVFVAGPVVVHTGGTQYFINLIRRAGWTWSSRATRWPFMTPVGAVRHVARCRPAHRRAGAAAPPSPHAGDQRHQPRRPHPPAWNRGSSRAASCSSASVAGVHYVLAGSIRDDGPNRRYADRHHRRAGSLCGCVVLCWMVIMLSTMLHGRRGTAAGVDPVVCVDLIPRGVRNSRPDRRRRSASSRTWDCFCISWPDKWLGERYSPTNTRNRRGVTYTRSPGRTSRR